LDEKIRLAIEAGSITEHDALIAGHLSNIICGGQSKGIASEQHFLDLERQAFLSLLGTAKTQERIAYLLTNNKPLHN
jgi:3-hydroxyacyl-CoA dehydrogenase